MNLRTILARLPVAMGWLVSAACVGALSFPMSMPDRAAAAGAVVVGRVLRVEPRPDRDVVADIVRVSRSMGAGSAPAARYRVPHQRARIAVRRVLKGSLAATAEVYVLFALEENSRSRRMLARGEDCLFYLCRDYPDGDWRVLNEPFGAVPLRGVERGADGSTLSEVEAVLAGQARRAKEERHRAPAPQRR